MKYKYIILFCVLISCKKNEYKVDWGGGLCNPSYYSVGISEIEFFSNGAGNLNIPGAFCGRSWNSRGQTRSFNNTALPDSVFISYHGMNNKNQTCLYEGGYKLPKEKLIELFKRGYEEKGDYGYHKEDFKNITVGMAPGGRVCVWADHVEIARFKIKEIKKVSNLPILLGDDNPAEFIKRHPIDYVNWDKPDVRYDLDYGFCSEDGKSKVFSDVISITKEGYAYFIFNSEIDFTEWNKSYGRPVTLTQSKCNIQVNEINHRDTKLSLPIQSSIVWKIGSDTFYSTNVDMPKDLADRFTTSYINPKTNKKSNYNRIIFGVEKDGEHCLVWLDGPEKQEKIMRFKGHKFVAKGTTLISDYATEVEYFK